MQRGEASNNYETSNDNYSQQDYDRMMKMRILGSEADQLEARSLNERSINNINNSEQLEREAKRRRALVHLLDCGLKNSNIIEPNHQSVKNNYTQRR